MHRSAQPRNGLRLLCCCAFQRSTVDTNGRNAQKKTSKDRAFMYLMDRVTRPTASSWLISMSSKCPVSKTTIQGRALPLVHYLMARVTRSTASSRLMSSRYPASNTAMALRLPDPMVQ